MTDRQRYINRIIRQATDNLAEALFAPCRRTGEVVLGATGDNPDPQWTPRNRATIVFFNFDEIFFSQTTRNDLRLAARIPGTTLDALARALYRR